MSQQVPEVALINQEPLKMSGSTSADREARAQTLVTLFVKFLGDHVDLLVQVRQDFLDKPKAETILGCQSFGEYCKNVLHYSESHIRRLIADRNPATEIYGAAVPATCQVCKKELSSKNQCGRHIREEHPDKADEILGKRILPQVAPPSESSVSSTPESPSGSDGSNPSDSLQSSPAPREELDAHKREHHSQPAQDPRGRAVPRPTSRATRARRARPTRRSDSPGAASAARPSPIPSPEPKPTEVFYIIQRKADQEFLQNGYEADHFGLADELSLRNVRRFPKPVEYSCVYFVPDGKRKEQELEKKEWGWVKVQITMENVQNGTDL